MRTRLAAKWILPIASPPIQNGVVEFEGERITHIGPFSDRHPGAVEDLGEVIIMPGLINAHTHLELSHLKGMIQPPKDLIDWLSQVLAHQKELTDSQLEELIGPAIREAVRSSLASGVTCVGDISRFCQLTRPLLSQGPLRVVSFGEVIGIGKRRHLVPDRLRSAADTTNQTDYLTTAISPHAPYSIEEDGVRQVVAQARSNHMRLAAHLAETEEEVEFLRTGVGRFREFLETLDVWDDQVPVPRKTPIRWADGIDLLGPDCLVAHGNYLEDEEIDLLCGTGTSVAYCPRTHAYFGHPSYPLLKLIGGGVNVCLGTDSLASNPSLSIIEEMRFVHGRFPEMPAAAILNLTTINAARALGMADNVGSLEPGKAADLAVFRIDPTPQRDPEPALLEHDTTLARLYIAGNPVIHNDS